MTESEKLTDIKDVVNVKDYGAKGDGIADDTAAVEAAEKARIKKGGALFFPAGTYRIKPPLKL